MQYLETRIVQYNADMETIQFMDNLEESLKEYWYLKGYHDEEIEQIDFRSNIHNILIGLFRRCNLSPTELVEYVTLSTSYEATGQLNGEYNKKFEEKQEKINKKIRNLLSDGMEC